MIYAILGFFRIQILEKVLVQIRISMSRHGPMGAVHGPGPCWALARPAYGPAGPSVFQNYDLESLNSLKIDAFLLNLVEFR